MEDEYNGLFKNNFSDLILQNLQARDKGNIMFIAPYKISIFKKGHNKTFIEK